MLLCIAVLAGPGWQLQALSSKAALLEPARTGHDAGSTLPTIPAMRDSFLPVHV
jgi:hypothetical protein